ncbi:MAG: leucyl aminopeptidase, partial [Alphaproteobacteria bacterium]|nr:leucyl aminopeptidase [Alphaproteobacteria bacterium]
MKIGFVAPAQPDKGALVVGVLEERKLTPAAAAADAATGGQLARAMEASRFKGKKKETLVVLAPSGVKASRIVLLGLGKAEELDATAAQDLGGEIVGTLQMSGETVATLLLEPPAGAKLGWSEAAAHMAFGARLRAYRFDKYKTREKEDQKPSLAELRIGASDQAAAAQALAPLDRIADGIELTRDVVSEPPNVIYPETFAAQCQALTGLGVAVEILGVAEMKKLGMGALLGVGQGSTREPRLVVMQWKGAGDAQPLAFVGKGVCFDTGGISIKPAAGMEDMKWDMAGAGAVLGAMKALAGRKAKANVIGVVALVENMPDGNAQRPSDIVTSMSGQTIE